MFQKIFIILVFTSSLLSSCEFISSLRGSDDETENQAIARVFDTYLYKKDLKGLVSEKASKKDSAIIISSYVDDWVKKQVMLNAAKENSETDAAEIQRRLDDYKYQLLVYEYAKKYTQENLDTTVSQTEIEQYYQGHLKDFELKQNIIKGIYLRLPNEAPTISKVKRWLLSSREQDLEKLKSYSYTYASMFSFEDTTWLDFSELIINTPFHDEIQNQVNTLKRRKFLETSDNSSVYFIKIKEYKIEDQISPLQFVRSKIINIIINRRKIKLQAKHENEIYQKAASNKDYEVY